jgi:hypothetical protein
MKSVMAKAGINIDIFGTHSCRTNFIEEVEADRQLCAPKISMLILALTITNFIEEVEADRQLCAPKISMLIPALAITNFIEEIH